jgi:phospholipid transport system transporter-binding protein
VFRPAATLTLGNAKSVRDAGLRAIAGGQNEIDLGELTAVDSSAVAVLLSWQRAAHAAGKPLAFRRFPDNLQSLAKLYGVADLLHPTSAQARADLPHH